MTVVDNVVHARGRGIFVTVSELGNDARGDVSIDVRGNVVDVAAAVRGETAAIQLTRIDDCSIRGTIAGNRVTLPAGVGADGIVIEKELDAVAVDVVGNKPQKACRLLARAAAAGKAAKAARLQRRAGRQWTSAVRLLGRDRVRRVRRR